MKREHCSRMRLNHEPAIKSRALLAFLASALKIGQNGFVSNSLPATARARARAEITAEIKASARRQLAEEGAAALSLRAVSRDLGMASSAIYRYFPSRDALLTALIIDAFDSIGFAAEQADHEPPDGTPSERWRRVSHAVRQWALDNPHEYALVYGSPVPGYIAPTDTAQPATRITNVFIDILAAAAPTTARLDVPEPPDAVVAEMKAIAPDLPATVMALGMNVWAQLFGLISLELFGHFETVIFDRDSYFDHQMSLAINSLGLLR